MEPDDISPETIRHIKYVDFLPESGRTSRPRHARVSHIPIHFQIGVITVRVTDFVNAQAKILESRITEAETERKSWCDVVLR